ncbi:phosphatidylserine decarboxylase [Rickenella mellea]|uniref:Phosphatidylserine decarboxylase proenzyme 1, mitochondrial n=1 Tax=Rickenella mellea TaxID=50990 RepID=A0A4Y7Q401_9AGAM|nr:phosphatidylserine decarboxylase [Rickenella mellea]
MTVKDAEKLAHAWRTTPTKWYPLPLIVGALLLVAINFRKQQRRHSKDEPHVQLDDNGREVIRLKGPWSVHVLGALPLRNMSRLWGYLNSLELPVWFRPTGFRIYAFIFGCNLEEAEFDDLTRYKSLGDFFYRRLKDGVRPIDTALLVSPADGKVLHFGTVQGMRVEQVKGMSYSLDALLGSPASPSTPTSQTISFENRDHAIVHDREFANVNGIEYSLNQLIGASSASKSNQETPPGTPDDSQPRKHGEQTDASIPHPDTPPSLSHDASVAASVGLRPSLDRSSTTSTSPQIKPQNRLFFAVIYLAPGDYHRFHSPSAWVVEKRRHFVGELFSVSPYMAARLGNLFVLNERVALLGRWRHGFFSTVPVGATNVGSILLNFDRELRTNERTTRGAGGGGGGGRRGLPPPGTFTEAVYSNASAVLGGQPLKAGEEMGGFCLGSTIVLVFEAPKEFVFDVHAGQRVRVGQRLGDLRGTK